MNRQLIFLLTFFTYAIVHMMRTAYSFNKHTFQKIFGIGDLFLGFIDSFIYLTLACGTFYRYSILNSHKPKQACLHTAIPTIIGFSVIPIMSLSRGQVIDQSANALTYIVMIVSFGCFGFFQLSFFPATLTIFSHHFNLKEDGRLVGIWSSKSNTGNIIGFFMANLLVYQLDVRWQYTMLICSVLLFIVCVMLYLCVQNPEFKTTTQITTPQFMRFFKGVWNQTQFKLYIISFSLFKAILYSYELWTPKFLADRGFASFSGYVPMLFDISTLFGSFIMGDIYKKESNNVNNNNSQSTSQIRKLLLKYKFFIPALFVVIICSCYIFSPDSLLAYFMLGALMGLFLGAIYNSLQNNQIMNYTQNDPGKTDMISTINIGIGCSLVGVSQFIIGFVLHIGQAHKDSTQPKYKLVKNGNIYVIIAIIAIIAAVITFLRTSYQRVKPISREQIELQFLQKNNITTNNNKEI